MRKSADVVGRLLSAMDEMVVSYHPTLRRTSSTLDGLIQGTAAFPGGAGLWRGRRNDGPLPEWFPESPVMFVGHNFDSLRGYEASRERGGEVGGQFWSRLLCILQAADIHPEACFFTNALMGLKPGKATGAMPSVPGYKTQCQAFLDRQVEIVKPSAVIALGAEAIKYVSRLRGTYITLRHPGDWVFRELSQRDTLLTAEGRKLQESLRRAGAVIKPAPWKNGQIDGKAENPVNVKEKVKRMKDTQTGRTDDWGFRIGTRNSFLMDVLEKGGKGKEQIKIEFLQRFPDSAGKSTFAVFFTDLIRPFGCASVSRCIGIESDQLGHLHLDAERARQIKAAIAAGILEEINSVEGSFPKKDQLAIDAIVEKYRVPRA